MVCYFTEKIFIGDLNLKIVNLDYFKKGNNYLLNDIMKSKNNINNSKSEMFSKNNKKRIYIKEGTEGIDLI